MKGTIMDFPLTLVPFLDRAQKLFSSVEIVSRNPDGGIIRSNYGDVSAFLMSGVEDRSHRAFHDGLATLASTTCLLIQSLIVAQVGPQQYAAILDEFTEGGGVDLGDPVTFLRERRRVLAPV